MFHRTYELLASEVSGERTRKLTADIWRHDRTSCFSEHYRAARLCADQLKRAGARDLEIIAFPATGTAKFGAFRIQRAWDCTDAELHIIGPESATERLCSWREDPYCLCQGSPATPKGGIEAEVVVIEGGAAEKDYRGRQVKGRIILTGAAPRGIQDLAKQQGAVGIVTDTMPTNPAVRPTPMDVPDARIWQVLRPEGKLPSFVLTPRQGQRLRTLIEAQRKDEPVRLGMWVDAKPFDGRSEMVSARIRGARPDEEIALIAHLYEPGANDNASGVAVLLEVVGALNRLIADGRLRRPRRSIRVWLTHEFQSLQALAYERPEEIERVIAAANVDQIGENQGESGASLMYQDGPDALPSYLNDYTHALMEYFDGRAYTWGNSDSREVRMATVNTPFWMNDNFISDPSVGVPSVAFIAWPDKYYHTSEDTIDRVDAQALARVAALTGTWAYVLAAAGEAEALAIAEMVAERSDGSMARAIAKRLDALRADLEKPAESENAAEKLADAAADLRERVDYLRTRELAALESVADLLTEAQRKRNAPALGELRGEIEDVAARWQGRSVRRLALLARELGLPAPQVPDDKPPAGDRTRSPAERRAAAIVPYRKLRGIVQNGELPKRAQAAITRASRGGVPRLMLFWVDGERSLLDICRATRIEGDGSPIDPARALKWAEAMKAAGVIGYRKSGG